MTGVRHFAIDRRLAFALLALLAAAGCSGSADTLADVNGTVTFDGRPVFAKISFAPQLQGRTSGRPSEAQTNPQGDFRLQFTKDQFGALVGDHRVTIKVMRIAHGVEPQTYLESVSPLKVVRLRRTVAPGKNRFHFALSD